MNASEIIHKAAQVIPQQFERGWRRIADHGEKLFAILTDWKALARFTIVPPVPDYFWHCLSWVTDLVDIIGDTLAAIPALVVAELVLDSVKVDRWFRSQVMTLEGACRMVFRVATESGIQNWQDRLPSEWGAANAVNKWTKIADFLDKPGLRSLWKLFKVGPWKIITLVVLYLFMFAKQIGVLVMLWNFARAIEDETQRKQIFRDALKQSNPRKSVKVRIRRRIGGVPP